jgi:hypothetical protein
MTLLQQNDELLEEPSDAISLDRIAVDRDLVAPHVDLDTPERAFDQPEQLVTLTEQSGHQVVAGNGDLDLSRAHWCFGHVLLENPRWWHPRGTNEFSALTGR